MKSRFKFFLYMISGQQSMAVKSAGPRVGVRPVRWGLIGIYRSTLGIKQSVGSQANIRLKKNKYLIETIYIGGVIMG